MPLKRQPTSTRLSPLELGLLDRNQQPAALIRRDGNLLYSNSGWVDLFGDLPPFSAGSGFRLWSRDGESVEKDGRIPAAASGMLMATDGSGLRIELSWTAIDSRHILAEARNLTASQNALRQRQQLLSSLPDAATLLRRRAAHDFNNAMFAAAAAHSQATEMLWSDQSELLEQMTLLGDALQMVDDIAGEILDRQAVAAGDCAADQLGRQAVALARAAFGSPAADIDFEACQIGLPLDVDRFQLLRALQNLLLNALHAASDGAATRPPRARLSISTIDGTHFGTCSRRLGKPLPDRQYVHFEISDSGPGIPDGIMSHIFEPYRSTRPPHVGSGLGLATVADVAISCGGYVDVWQSRPLPAPGSGPDVMLEGALFRLAVPVDEFGHRPSSIAPTVCVLTESGALRDRLAYWLRRGGYSVVSGSEPGGDLVVADRRLNLPDGRPVIELGSGQGQARPGQNRICLELPVYGQHFMRAVRLLCPPAKLT